MYIFYIFQRGISIQNKNANTYYEYIQSCTIKFPKKFDFNVDGCYLVSLAKTTKIKTRLFKNNPQTLISSSSATIISEFIEFRSYSYTCPTFNHCRALLHYLAPHLTVKPSKTDLSFFGKTVGRGPLSMKILKNGLENLESKRKEQLWRSSSAN